MNVLYISPNFPPNYYFFPLRLKELGATVVGIGWASYESLRPELKASLTEYCRVEDMDNYDHVLRAAGYLTSRVGKLDRVAAQEEHWLDLAARLRLDLNVPGKKPEEMRTCRHKSLMKETFKRAGIPVAEGQVALDLETARAVAKETGYPLIAKPDKGVGAHGTFKLEGDSDLEEFFAVKPPEIPCILETFLEGVIQSFDGLVDREGAIVFRTAHQYGKDVMTTVNLDEDIHYWSLRDIPADLEDYGRRVVAAFDMRESFFHIEFFRSPKGRLTAMEMNARPPGGLTTDMFNYANDFDCYRAWAELVVRGKTSVPAERPYHACYVGRKLRKDYLNGHEDVLAHLGPAVLMHTAIDSVFRQAIGDYAYMVRGKTMEDVQPMVDFIHEVRS